MITRGYSRVVAAAVAGWVVLTTGCGQSKPAAGTRGSAGTVGSSYLVTVFRPTGGTVDSSPPGIHCGTAGTACGPISFPWTTVVTLTATPDAGNMLGTWAGDCMGNATCVLSTTPYGADKYVVASFGPSGLTQHPTFSDHNVHGPAYIQWQWSLTTPNPNVYQCNACHGAKYNGQGIAPSCNACHAQALGVTNTQDPSLWQGDCTFCHGAPPPPGPYGFNQPPWYPQSHPQDTVVADPTGTKTICADCHPDTVDRNGQIIPASQGGKHLNGTMDGGGHPDGFDNPQQHGREFFGVASTTPNTYCQGCHGTNFEKLVPAKSAGGALRSCNMCHATAGWGGVADPLAPVAGSGWQKNCSFCHGTKNSQTLSGPYDVNASQANAALAAPPDTIAQRLQTAFEPPDRVGAHQAHLASSIATVACGACHTVPSTTAHISGKDVRATVIVTAPNHPPNPNAYDPAGQTCATWCHDPMGNGTKPSPAWTVTTIACNGCHDVPPNTDAHIGVSGSDLTTCNGCHPLTIGPDGKFNTAPPPNGSGHINGNVDSPAGHAQDFYLPANHGNAFLDRLAGVSGSLNCLGCHTGYANCNKCHQNPAAQAVDAGGTTTKPELLSYTTQWQSWQTNCTFCHGTRTATYGPADVITTDPTLGARRALAAPADDISMRFDGIELPDRTGFHTEHLIGTDGLVPYGPAFPCASCHVSPLPTDFNHIMPRNDPSPPAPAADPANGIPSYENDRRAYPSLMAFDFAAAFPNSGKTGGPGTLGSYDGDRTSPTYGSCTVYCHGSLPNSMGQGLGGTGGANGAWYWYDGFPNYTGGCNDCHGQPPKTGSTITSPNIVVSTNKYCGTTNGLPGGTAVASCDNHTLHKNALSKNGFDSCGNCHFGSASNLDPSKHLHINGVADIIFGAPVGKVPTSYPTWTPPVPPSPQNPTGTPGSCSGSTGTGNCHFQTPTSPHPW